LAYPQGFTFVSGPLFVREFNLASACTVAALQPVKLDAHGDIVESLGTDSILAGFIVHRAIDSVPAGKCLVAIPADGRTVWAGICASTVTQSATSSGATLGMIKSGNSWYLSKSASTVTAIFVVVPREDASTFDSTDSSVFVQVLGIVPRPFNESAAAPAI